MYIIDPTPQTMEALMRLEISAGVDITMKQD
jgi:ribosomal protein S10